VDIFLDSLLLLSLMLMLMKWSHKTTVTVPKARRPCVCFFFNTIDGGECHHYWIVVVVVSQRVLDERERWEDYYYDSDVCCCCYFCGIITTVVVVYLPVSPSWHSHDSNVCPVGYILGGRKARGRWEVAMNRCDVCPLKE